MKYGIYSIRDKLAGYGLCNCNTSDDTAKRQFEMLVNDESATILSTHPSDFELYCIGEFDSDSGKVTAVNPPKLIVKGESYVQK